MYIARPHHTTARNDRAGAMAAVVCYSRLILHDTDTHTHTQTNIPVHVHCVTPCEVMNSGRESQAGGWCGRFPPFIMKDSGTLRANYQSSTQKLTWQRVIACLTTCLPAWCREGGREGGGGQNARCPQKKKSGASRKPLRAQPLQDFRVRAQRTPSRHNVIFIIQRCALRCARTDVG